MKDYAELSRAFESASALFGSGLPTRNKDYLDNFDDALKPLLAEYGDDEHAHALILGTLDEMFGRVSESVVLLLAFLIAERAAEAAERYGAGTKKALACGKLEGHVAVLWQRILLLDDQQTIHQKDRKAQSTLRLADSSAMKIAALDVLEELKIPVRGIPVQPR